ncbi:MAG: hypothetical protein LEGION0398_MBIBDBAK_01312 [Legionellaceae bacterium]
MMNKLIKHKSEAIDIAKFLLKSGEVTAAQKIMFEIVKDDPKDKHSRFMYATMFSTNDKKEENLKEEIKIDNNQNKI